MLCVDVSQAVHGHIQSCPWTHSRPSMDMCKAVCGQSKIICRPIYGCLLTCPRLSLDISKAVYRPIQGSPWTCTKLSTGIPRLSADMSKAVVDIPSSIVFSYPCTQGWEGRQCRELTPFHPGTIHLLTFLPSCPCALQPICSLTLPAVCPCILMPLHYDKVCFIDVIYFEGKIANDKVFHYQHFLYFLGYKGMRA